MPNSPKEIRDKEIAAGVQILKDMRSDLAVEFRRALTWPMRPPLRLADNGIRLKCGSL